MQHSHAAAVMPAVGVLPARRVIIQQHLQSEKTGVQAFGKTAVQTGTELRSGG